MNAKISTSLGRSARLLGQSAKRIEARISGTTLDPANYERLIGFGTACDWLNWAKDLKALSYTNKRRNRSERAYAMNEITRFTFIWTAANALFARSEILKILDPAFSDHASELERFRLLFNHSGMSPADVISAQEILHTLLSQPMHVQQFPWTSFNNPPTVMEIIYFKYTTPRERSRGIGRRLSTAARTGSCANLDLPTLIYANRNWNIHGVLLSSFFRGTRKKFNLWIDTINLSLANIIEGSANVLQSHL
jgi:hypothetical protein